MTAETQAPKAKKETVYNTVTMEDGRVVDFPGTRKILKDGGQLEDGTLAVRIDFANGKTVNFALREDMIPLFAVHGALQKLGDAASGAEDVDDAFEAINELALRLSKGPEEWTAKREGSGKGSASGASILVKALCEIHPQRTADEIRQWLSSKDHATKMALRRSPELAPIVQRLEVERAAKAGKGVDSSALIQELA